MANCVVCGEDLESNRLVCPRCGTDNSHVTDLREGYLRSFWGALSFLLVFPPLFMLLPGIFPRLDEALQPVAAVRVGGPIALLNALVIAFYMFSLRDDLYHFSHLRRFKTKPAPELPVLALILFVMAVLFAFILTFAVTTKDSLVAPPGFDGTLMSGLFAYGGVSHLVLKLAMTGLLMFVFLCFSLSAGTMAAYEYVQYADQRRPYPIYLNEQLMIQVVLGVVRDHLDRISELKVVDLKRLQDGGISLELRYRGEPTVRGNMTLIEERTWIVEADRWARVTRIDEQKERFVPVSQS